VTDKRGLGGGTLSEVMRFLVKFLLYSGGIGGKTASLCVRAGSEPGTDNGRAKRLPDLSPE